MSSVVGPHRFTKSQLPTSGRTKAQNVCYGSAIIHVACGKYSDIVSCALWASLTGVAIASWHEMSRCVCGRLYTARMTSILAVVIRHHFGSLSASVRSKPSCRLDSYTEIKVTQWLKRCLVNVSIIFSLSISYSVRCLCDRDWQYHVCMYADVLWSIARCHGW